MMKYHVELNAEKRRKKLKIVRYRVMLRYDIDWYLAFQGNVSTSLINRLINTLGLDEYDAVPYSNADLTYKIKRSLDIMLPVILTKCIGYHVNVFRDCGVNKFIIKISN